MSFARFLSNLGESFSCCFIFLKKELMKNRRIGIGIIAIILSFVILNQILPNAKLNLNDQIHKHSQAVSIPLYRSH